VTVAVVETPTPSSAFDALIGELTRWLIDDSGALSPERNPVFRDCPGYSYPELLQVLGQYNIFSREIVSLLEAAQHVAAAEGRYAVSQELEQNIAEELGADGSTAESHYELLCRGFKRSLGVDPTCVIEERATARFFRDVIDLAGDPNPAVGCGAVYALECTAVPELRETYSMTKRLFALSGVDLDGCISKFFEGHIRDIEVGHEIRLADACREDVTESEFPAFDLGFRSVVQGMIEWWSGLSETIRSSDYGFQDTHHDVGTSRFPSAEEMSRRTMPRLQTTPPAATLLAAGFCISPGAAVGRISTDVDAFLADRSTGRNTILVVDTMSNALLADLGELCAVIACREDSSTHAAIVARVRRLPVVSGAAMSRLRAADGATVTVDATGGSVYFGAYTVLPAEPVEDLRALCGQLAANSPLRGHGNCDTAEEMQLGAAYGAVAFEARSEHMFADPTQLASLQGALLFEGRDDLLSQYEATLTQELGRCLNAADGRPIHLRLLDPPIDEFVPKSHSEVVQLARALSVEQSAIEERSELLAEENPLLGRRGARLLLQRPDLLRAQISAMACAYLAADPEGDRGLYPHICLPFVFEVREVERLRQLVELALTAAGWIRPALIGVMLEIPQALLDARRFADVIDFASVGSNDLTALLHGMARGSAYEEFLGRYLSDGLLEVDPFVTLDPVCERLIAFAVDELHVAKPGIQVSLCGEQAGSRATVESAMRIGLDALSVAPVNVPTLYAQAIEIQGQTRRAAKGISRR
jgi:phosphohistidine swiveling domain-containing protein